MTVNPSVSGIRRSRTNSVLTKVVQDALSEQEALEQDERGELEGLTCMAKVKAGPSGEPLLEEVSVSTAPWALGRVRAEGLSGLDFDVFQDSIEALRLDLRQFRAARAVEVGAQGSVGNVWLYLDALPR